jgi:hypothetical protein
MDQSRRDARSRLLTSRSILRINIILIRCSADNALRATRRLGGGWRCALAPVRELDGPAGGVVGAAHLVHGQKIFLRR